MVVGMAWTRHGDCNRCGYCCEFMGPVAMTTRVNGEGRLDKALWELRRPAVRDVSNREVLYIGHTYLPCSAHHLPSTCTIYDTRPETCRTFPVHPDQIEETPCSHWFES